MNKEKEILSNLIIFSKYAKYRQDLKRRETWDEIVDRYEKMMYTKYPSLKKQIVKNAKLIRERKILPSMRALQFAGLAIEVNNARGYNCCYLPVDSIYAFSETMFLLLGGTGVGYSVQTHHVDALPTITVPHRKRRYLIQDSIIGWADAVKALMKAYLEGASLPEFDFRDIRPKGAVLKTAGGKAPGPEPLKKCLQEIQRVLDRKQDGEKLKPIDCHDIMCHIANAVLAGGIRRAAMIALFSYTDIEMLECKFGNWWELNEQRGRANNSAVLKRGEISEEQFFNLWKKVELSGSGEPGFYWTNDTEWGTNPCCEAALRAFQFCNKTEINGDDIESQEELNKRAEAAAFFGTLQAGFTDFHYLRPIWKRTTEKDALLGIGITGVASIKVLALNLQEAAGHILASNKTIAEAIDINPASRTTWEAPSGTTSLVLGCSSGIHAWHWDYFLRTVRFNMNEDVASHMLVNHPELCEVDKVKSTVLCVRVPMKAPSGAILRTESPLNLLARVKHFSETWIKAGHREGTNTHNVSATISVKENEWEEVGQWMWENRNSYNGLSVIPYDGGTYVQTPFENCTEEEYLRRMETLVDVDLTKVSEVDDNTAFTQEAACAGGKCII